MCNIAHQIQAGYPGIQHSGKATSCAPPFAASSMSLHVFVTDLGRSSHSGSAWVTATRMIVGGISLDDIVFSDNAAARDHARIFGCKVSALSKQITIRWQLSTPRHRSRGPVEAEQGSARGPLFYLCNRLHRSRFTHYVSFWRR